MKTLYIPFFLTIFASFIVHSAEVPSKKNQDQAPVGFVKSILGKSEDWVVMKANPNGKDTCYSILYTENRQGNQKFTEEKPYIMVHYFSQNRSRFSVYFGYELTPDKIIHMSIDSKQFKLKSFNLYGISPSQENDTQIISQLVNSKQLMVRGEGENYSYSVDLYSTKGFSEALKIMQDNCDNNESQSNFKTINPSKN